MIAAGESVISLEGVFKIFGNQPEGRALELARSGMGKNRVKAETGHVVGLDNVTFSVRKGEIFVLMGLSGSGKSTAVRTVNKLHDITAGSVVVDGIDVQGLSGSDLQAFRRKYMGMVFQHFALFPHRRVIANVCYGLKVQGVRRAAREKRGMKALELVGLAAYAKSLPSELSGGMQQRVGLARALASDPDILLMDEAFSALDPLDPPPDAERDDGDPRGSPQDDPVHNPRSQRGSAHRRPGLHHEGWCGGADRYSRRDSDQPRHRLRGRIRAGRRPGSGDSGRKM